MAWSRRILFILGGLLIALVVLAGLAMLVLNSGAGRGFVKDQVEALEFENGLKIGLGSIDGSLTSTMILRDLTLADPQGVFAKAPEVTVEWNPFAFVFGVLDVDAVIIETASLSRVPQFNETPPSDAPLLPDYTIAIDEFALKRLLVEASVTGTERVAQISGMARIADRKAQVSLFARSVAGADETAAGDEVRLTLAAVPQENRLDLDLVLNAPADGVIAALSGWTYPLEARLEGKGTWAKWDGQLNANRSDQRLAMLDVTAREGTFTINGDAQLGDIAPDALSDLVDGVTVIEAEARLGDSATMVSARLSGQAFTLQGAGGVALEAGQFDDFKVDLELLRPSALLPNLAGSNVNIGLAISGDLARPLVAYDLTAQRLAYGTIGVSGFAATGEAVVDPADMVLPVSARARRVVGLDEAAGGPISNVTLVGDILIAWPRLVSDNLRLRSARLDAGLTLIADASSGRYGGALDGRLDDYRLESVGLFDVTTTATMDADLRSGTMLKGTVQARSTQVTNGGVSAVLGGDAVASANVAYGRDGVTRVSEVRVASPLLEVTGGAGTYSAAGELDITAQGYSADYGPLSLQVNGTPLAPIATLSAPAPGLGVGLANVTALIRGEEQRYRIEADGETDFGAFTTLLIADLSGGRLTLDVERGELGGIGLQGSLEQSDEGPFSGELVASGNGLSGTVVLAGRGAAQTARITARARNLTFPGAANARIGRGNVDAMIVLGDEREIDAELQLANARYFETAIDTMRMQVDIKGATGSARLLATGNNAVPFRLAANAQLEPDLWRAAIKGSVRGIDFRTDNPARIIPASANAPPGAGASADAAEAPVYQLLPTRLVFDEGSVRLSGRFGSSLEIKSRLDSLDLAIFNRFVPGLGINGKASGSLDFVQASEAAAPSAKARIIVTGFSRSTALTVSAPVDLSLAGELREMDARARAVIRQRGNVIGRINADLALAPLQSEPWLDRLMAARLSGGARYTGPAGVLFSLAGLADQELSGTAGVAVDFSGRLAEPGLEGIVRANDLTYENETFGTRLSGIKTRGKFSGDELVIDQFESGAGKGRVSATGTISLAAQRGFPMDLAISLDKAQLARSKMLGASATGELTLTKREGKRALLAGTLVLPETRYTLAYPGAAQVPELTGVRFVSDGSPAVATETQTKRAAEPGFEDVRLDLKLVADDELYVSGMGLQSEWSADLRVTGTSADPRMTGEIDLVRGTLAFAGRDFDVDEGLIRFTGGATFDPQIAIKASERIKDVAISVDVSGSAFVPQFAFTSTPGLPQDEIIARILFGSSIANLSPLEAVQLARSLNSLSGSGGGLNPLGALQSATGLDRLRVLASDDAAGRSTALAAGQYISDDIYVEVITDARGFTATQIEISLTPTLSILSQAGGAGGTNVNVRYRKDY